MTDSTVDRRSVFIGGASRSGTTMLGAMLGSHSRMITAPESQFKFDVTPLFESSVFDRQHIISFISNHPRFKVWKFDVNWKTVDFSGPGKLITSIVDQFSTWKNKSQAAYWVDHTPTNLRHTHMLNNQYPGCYYIHIVRDGRAVMASQFALDWGSNDPVFASMKWIEPLCVGLACESAFPDRCLRVHYEQLVLHPEEECNRICAFLGLEYEPGMIKGESFDVPSYTRPHHQLVGQLPDPTRIDDWKKTLKRKDIQLFESMTFDLLSMLGYKKEFPGFVPKPGELAQAWILVKGAMKYLTLNSLKRKIRLSNQNESAGSK